MSQDEFATLMASITTRMAARALDKSLEADLNRVFPAGGDVYRSVLDGCHSGIAAGWMCSRERGGIRYGRVVAPSSTTHGFSVDVVAMDNNAGGHHRHPNGEIDLIMPIDADARFDGHGAGWLLYEPGTAHVPTTTGGKALVLYLLPEGAIEFTKT